MNAPLIVITGASGQLGQTLGQHWHSGQLSKQFDLRSLTRSQLDIANPENVRTILSDLKPAIIINTAAYTQVDRAEVDRDSAFLVNDAAVAGLATWSAQNHSRIIHVSTDFVFDGAGNNPYLPHQQTAPLGVYGRSKLAGEERLLALLKEKATVIRTSWLYSEYGNNFVKTVLRLMQDRDELCVVDDQLGSPSSTHGLAELIFAMIPGGQYQGVYHWTDGGSISWFEFAQKIQQLGLRYGLLNRQIPIRPIATSEYPTAARRPAYSVLDRSRTIAAFACPDLSWEQQLAAVIKALATAQTKK